MYIVVPDDKDDGYFLLVKFDKVSNKFDKVKDEVSKKDYPTKEQAREYFKTIYKEEIY